MSTAAQLWGSTFRSLQIRNFKLFFGGQFVSQVGTWMTMIAQTLLVLDLTGSGIALGMLAAAQFGPILVMGPWTGTLADRVDKRTLLFVTQTGAMLQSLALGLIVLTGHATVGNLIALAGVQGILTAFDNPARRSFVVEMVPPTHVANAVSLNSTIMTGARVVGPALAGLVVGTLGYAWCFLLDGISFVAVLACLALMRPGDLFSAEKTKRGRGQVREGLRYVRNHNELFVPMVMAAIIGTLAFNFSVSIPLLVTGPLGGSEQAFTIFFSVMSLGSVIGALATARRTEIPPSHLVGFAAVFGVAMVALASSPVLGVAYPIALLVGAASVGFMTTSTATVQLQAAPGYRGRVLALQGMVFLGSTPIGGPLIGWIADTWGPRSAVLVGGISCLAAAVWGHRAFKPQAPSIGVVQPQPLGTGAK